MGQHLESHPPSKKRRIHGVDVTAYSADEDVSDERFEGDLRAIEDALRESNYSPLSGFEYGHFDDADDYTPAQCGRDGVESDDGVELQFGRRPKHRMQRFDTVPPPQRRRRESDRVDPRRDHRGRTRRRGRRRGGGGAGGRFEDVDRSNGNGNGQKSGSNRKGSRSGSGGVGAAEVQSESVCPSAE